MPRLPVATHRAYDEMRPVWRKMRDVIAGEDTIKARGESYLPRLGGQDADGYRGYLQRAMFFGATGRTLQGLLGAIMRKEPVVHVPPAAEHLLDNVTQAGDDLVTFTRAIVEEQLTTGRCGLLVDMGARGGPPYARIYQAETIVDWHVSVVDGRPVLDRVALAEVLDDPPADNDNGIWVRVLELDAHGRYRQRIVSPDGDETVIVPSRLGRPLDFLPFEFIGANDNKPTPDKPPLLDLANVNLSHYRSSADLEHGRHFTALPTPYIVGADPEEHATDRELVIGSGAVWMLPAGSHPGLLEFTGAGLKHLENALAEKERLMVQLGARMLESQKRAAETAEAMRLRQAGDCCMLSVISATASRGLERALGRLVDWAGIPGADTVRVRLNHDFLDARMPPAEIQALVKAWQDGAIGLTDLHANLVRGEIIDPDRTTIDIMKEIERNAKIPA